MNPRPSFYKATRKIKWTPNLCKSQIAEADFTMKTNAVYFEKKEEIMAVNIDEMAEIIDKRMTEKELAIVYDCMDKLPVSDLIKGLNDDDHKIIQDILSFSDPNQMPRESRRIDFDLVEESQQLSTTKPEAKAEEITPIKEQNSKFVIKFDTVRTVKVERSVSKIQILDAQLMTTVTSTSDYNNIYADFVVSEKVPDIIFEEDSPKKSNQ